MPTALPWLLALPIALLFSAWHRVFFIGLHSFDDAWYQATADDHERGAFMTVTRAVVILLYQAAAALAPSRSWAVLGLGTLKTYLLIAATTSLLRRELGVPLALAVATLAATSTPWQHEYTFVLPDSWMTVLCLCCLACLHGGARARLGLAGGFFALAFYTKEVAGALLVVVLRQARGALRAYWRFALGALVTVVAVSAIVTTIQRSPWSPVGLAAAIVPGPAATQSFVTKLMKFSEFALDDTMLGQALTAFFALGFAASLVVRAWTTAAGRALAAWTVVIWIAYPGVVALAGFYDPRYTIGPRVALITCGVAGWLLLITRARLSPLRTAALQASLVVVLMTLVAVPALRAHRDIHAQRLIAQDLERRVADLIDRLPVSTPVTLFMHAADPEDTMGGAWWPDRVLIRLVTLSETTPPRRVRLIRRPGTLPPPGEVYITNVAPGTPSPETVQVTFVSPATEAHRLARTRRLPAEIAKRYLGVRKLYVVLPREVADAVRPDELTGPIRTMWR